MLAQHVQLNWDFHMCLADDIETGETVTEAVPRGVREETGSEAVGLRCKKVVFERKKQALTPTVVAPEQRALQPNVQNNEKIPATNSPNLQLEHPRLHCFRKNENVANTHIH